MASISKYGNLNLAAKAEQERKNKQRDEQTKQKAYEYYANDSLPNHSMINEPFDMESVKEGAGGRLWLIAKIGRSRPLTMEQEKKYIEWRKEIGDPYKKASSSVDARGFQAKQVHPKAETYSKVEKKVYSNVISSNLNEKLNLESKQIQLPREQHGKGYKNNDKHAMAANLQYTEGLDKNVLKKQLKKVTSKNNDRLFLAREEEKESSQRSSRISIENQQSFRREPQIKQQVNVNRFVKEEKIQNNVKNQKAAVVSSIPVNNDETKPSKNAIAIKPDFEKKAKLFNSIGVNTDQQQKIQKKEEKNSKFDEIKMGEFIFNQSKLIELLKDIQNKEQDIKRLVREQYQIKQKILKLKKYQGELIKNIKQPSLNEEKSHQKLNSPKIQNQKIFVSNILYDAFDKHQLIIKNIEIFTQKTVKNTSLLFKSDEHWKDFAKYLPLEQQRSFPFVFLFKTTKGHIFGTFSQGLCTVNSPKYHSFLFSVDNEIKFQNSRYANDMKSVKYSQDRLIFGNNELSITNNSLKMVKINNDNFAKPYYLIPNIQILTGQQSRQIYLSQVEMHRIIFS